MFAKELFVNFNENRKIHDDYVQFNESRTSYMSSVVLTLAFTAYTAPVAIKLVQRISNNDIIEFSLGTFTSIFMTIVLLCSYILLYLNKCKRQQLNVSPALLTWIPLIQNFVLMGIVVSSGLRLFSRIYKGQCSSFHLKDMIDCNPNQITRGLPQDSVAVTMLIPIVYSLALKDVSWQIVMAAWAVTNACLIATVALTDASSCVIMLVIYIPVSAFVLYDNQRQNVEVFMLTQRLTFLLSENERMAAETHATEMRHMIRNVAHDLKTPLSSFLTGIEYIMTVVADFEEKSGENSVSSGRAPSASTRASECMASIKSCIGNMKNTNSFMIMTINRCIDYTKASNGLKLVPKYETICVQEALSLPLKVMGDMQSKVEIRLESISPNICSHVITDKQWLQENVLCLLSNAVKYSSKGLVTITITLHNENEAETVCPKGFLTSFSGSNKESRGSRDENAKQQPKDKRKRIAHIKVHPSAAHISSNATTNSNSPSNNSFKGHHKYTLSAFSLPSIRTAFSPAAAYDAPEQEGDLEAGRHHDQEDVVTVLGDKMCGVGEMSVVHESVSERTADILSASFLRVEVEDTGIGLSEEAMGNLFNPFKQAQRMAGGTGLGLYSLARRVEALKGTYGVGRRKDGEQGSNFWFSIPYRPDLAAAQDLTNSVPSPNEKLTPQSVQRVVTVSPNSRSAAVSPSAALANTTGKLRILLVDDAISILKMTGLMLRRQGHTVEQAENGMEALEKLLARMQSARTEEMYDVVLMDLQMPVMDGFEATRRLRQKEKRSNSVSYSSPNDNDSATEMADAVVTTSLSRRLSYYRLRRHQLIIGVSANSDHDTMEEALAAGIDAFMGKPFSMNCFYETYNRLLLAKQARESHQSESSGSSRRVGRAQSCEV